MSGTTRGPDPVHVRLHLLLVVLPWLAEHGDTTVAEVASVFGVSEARMRRVLETAMMCGRPPFGGGDNLDIVLFDDDGTVQVGPRLASEVRPPRLTPREAVQVLAALRAALALPGADPDGPLARVTAKLESVLGSGIDVTLDEPPMLQLVRAAVDGGEQLHLTYFSANRGELSERTIDPHLVFSRDGEWYVWADDSRSGSRRAFRVDRIEAAERTGERVAPDATEPPADWFAEGDVTEVTLVLPAAARWLAEQYPVRSIRELSGGAIEVTLPVATDRFLERLLVRAGPEAHVVAPPDKVDVGRRAAARLLERYDG